MNHFDYYEYQTKARGVNSLTEIREIALTREHVYNRILLPNIPNNKDARIVELACGHGSLLYWLKMQGYQQVLGIDSSQEQLNLALEVGYPLENADAIEWLSRTSNDNVDLVLGIDLVEHLSKDNFMEMLKEVHRVLLPGGILALRYPNGDSPFVGLNLFNDITHVWTYTTNCMNTLSLMHGYSSVSFTDESSAALRDLRWLKVPMSKISTWIMQFLVFTVTREKIHYLSPHIWAFFKK